jgi:hypothetical protein
MVDAHVTERLAVGVEHEHPPVAARHDEVEVPRLQEGRDGGAPSLAVALVAGQEVGLADVAGGKRRRIGHEGSRVHLEAAAAERAHHREEAAHVVPEH